MFMMSSETSQAQKDKWVCGTSKVDLIDAGNLISETDAEEGGGKDEGRWASTLLQLRKN